MVSNSFDAASATAAARVRSEATKVAWQVEKFIRRVDLRSRQIFSLCSQSIYKTSVDLIKLHLREQN